MAEFDVGIDTACRLTPVPRDMTAELSSIYEGDEQSVAVESVWRERA
jgi:hypothetical protein